MAEGEKADPPSRRRDRLRRRSGVAATPAVAEVPRLTRYVEDGRPSPAPGGASVADGLRFAEGASDRMTMSLYPRPTTAAIHELAEAWELHPLVVEDLLHARQRPKVERYGDLLFLVVRSAWYVDAEEDVVLAEFHVLVRPGAVAVLCQDGRWIDGTPAERLDESTFGSEEEARALLPGEDLLRLGPEAVVYRFLDAIVDGYTPVLQGVAIDKEQIERQVFSGDAAVAERIYRLSQEVIDMQHATSSMTEVVEALRAGSAEPAIATELQTYLQDVSDHLTRATARVAEYREALGQILDVNATLVAHRQNEDMKKISGWAAILFAPTLVAAVYGMNFDVMPELHWVFGYPMAVTLMVAFSVVLFVVFKRGRWM
ncbi:magnesium and cobalt transport protein CorA [Isoptericola sp. b515]|uniref:magnesium and cobalt transport protein CorA n=1 Tax=Isoptericola sp. b515 TaxID=3064652 RepID=UPI002713F587|nr:magnesium and cobalt transport protein CorA [Isoptericola sp. b515]MDO8148246.1 magnesium and cobalt transport protein CorA [Isoptericola sp. b515]